MVRTQCHQKLKSMVQMTTHPEDLITRIASFQKNLIKEVSFTLYPGLHLKALTMAAFHDYILYYDDAVCLVSLAYGVSVAS